MKFWDSSALVPLLVREPSSPAMRKLMRVDSAALVWVLSETEIASALWRRRRSRELDEASRAAAEAQLRRIAPSWSVVLDPIPVGQRARRLLGRHPLSAADALQLAAALIGCDERAELLPFVTLDDRLAEAARAEGFAVLPRRQSA